jgi:hypothetical protein
MISEVESCELEGGVVEEADGDDSVDVGGGITGVVEFEVPLTISSYFTQHWMSLPPGHGQFGWTIKLVLIFSGIHSFKITSVVLGSKKAYKEKQLGLTGPPVKNFPPVQFCVSRSLQ